MVQREKPHANFPFEQLATLLRKSCIILKNFETSSAPPGILEGSLGVFLEKWLRVHSFSSVEFDDGGV